MPGRKVLAIGLLAALLLAEVAVGQDAQGPTDPATGSKSATGTRRAILACGLPGDDEHRALYAGAIEKIAAGLVERCGFEAANVWVRFGVDPVEGDGPALKGSRGLSTLANLTLDAEAIRQVSTSEDGLWVIVLGHGHHDGRRSHLNLPGPDPNESAFARLFDGIKAKEQVFFLTTSASGFFLKALAKPGRVAITATEADQEVNETLYPLALADVLTGPPPEADRDKDGSLSVFEMYLAVVADVMRRYVEDELIATEHAQIDDNGDGRGSEPQLRFLPPESGGEVVAEKAKDKPAPTLKPKDDGFLASQIRLDRRTTASPPASNPEAQP